MHQVTRDAAFRLFDEARGFSSGRVPYILEDSEIRHIALAVFGVSHTTHLLHVCNEIFYVVACDRLKVDRCGWSNRSALAPSTLLKI
jgi:hypothetical protein